LGQSGVCVCVNYAGHADAAEALVAEIASLGRRAIAVAADVADPAAVEAMVARTEAELGPVTPSVNNAGVSWQGTLDTYDPEQVARMRRVNVEGAIHATRAVMGSMRARRYGRIVNMASVAAIGTALSGNAFYAATKAEVVILTRRFALELGQHGITVNAVAPGFVRTDLTQRGRGAADWPGTEQRFAARAMMGRIGEPEDIANAVVFLVARFIQIEGYRCLSLMRASGVVKCQLALAWLAFLSFSQATISSMRVCLSGMRRSRHWDDRTPSSDSARSSQLPCFGVWCHSKRSTRRLASTAGKAS